MFCVFFGIFTKLYVQIIQSCIKNIAGRPWYLEWEELTGHVMTAGVTPPYVSTRSANVSEKYP